MHKHEYKQNAENFINRNAFAQITQETPNLYQTTIKYYKKNALTAYKKKSENLITTIHNLQDYTQ